MSEPNPQLHSKGQDKSQQHVSIDVQPSDSADTNPATASSSSAASSSQPKTGSLAGNPHGNSSNSGQKSHGHGQAPGPTRDDAISSVAKVLHRHIIMSRDEQDSRDRYGSSRSTPRISFGGRLTSGQRPIATFEQSPGSGWTTPSASSHTSSTLGSPAIGTPYSSLSSPPQMAIDLDARPSRFDEDIFDIDHYLARSYSVQVPLMPRAHSFSVYEQRRQYHTVPVPIVEHVYKFIKRVFDQARLNAECVIIALIYIERLMETRGLVLTSRNWIPIVTTALLSASKVWDDHSSYNAEFAAILPIFTLQQLNSMERCFLSMMSYELYISSSVYSAYYFGLRSIKNIRDASAIPRYYHQHGNSDRVINETSKRVEAKTATGSTQAEPDATISSSTNTSAPTNDV